MPGHHDVTEQTSPKASFKMHFLIPPTPTPTWAQDRSKLRLRNTKVKGPLRDRACKIETLAPRLPVQEPEFANDFSILNKQPLQGPAGNERHTSCSNVSHILCHAVCPPCSTEQQHRAGGERTITFPIQAHLYFPDCEPVPITRQCFSFDS